MLLEKLLLLVCVGVGIFFSECIIYVSEVEDNYCKLKLFLIKGMGKFIGFLFEDDGEIWGYIEGNVLWFEWELDCIVIIIELRINIYGDYCFVWEILKVIIF